MLLRIHIGDNGRLRVNLSDLGVKILLNAETAEEDAELQTDISGHFVPPF